MKSKVLENKRNKETALLNSAFDLFTKKDIHSVTVQDIVKKADVAKGTFYLYFKDKYQIRDVLIQKEAARLFQEAREKLEKNDIQNAILMLRKTIEKNKKDIDACKLLANIYIATDDIPHAIKFIAAVLKQFGNNGDFYYLAAKAYEKMQNYELYEKNLEMALNNHQTLTYNHISVQKELMQFRKNPKYAAENI